MQYKRREAALMLAGWVAIGVITWTRSAPAEPVVFGFRGTVRNVFDGLQTLHPQIVPGVPFRGAYVFDSETPNTAPPIGEGQAGLYHHDRPPAGVIVHVGGLTFYSTFRRPNFDIIVNNDFGFAGADEYGFFSYSNRSFPRVRGDLLQIDWFASTITQQVFTSADLPLDPPDLSLLGGGEFKIYGECTPCAAPAAFFRITGPVTSLVEISTTSLWYRSMLNMSALDADFFGHDISGWSVPEPGSLTGLLSGSALAWATRRRRSRRR